MFLVLFKWDENYSSKAVDFKDTSVTSSSGHANEPSQSELALTSQQSASSSFDDFDCHDSEEEFKNEYLRPIKVTVSDGNAFKTVIGNQPMTPGGRYFFEVQITSGFLIKIGICRANTDPEKVGLRFLR